MRFKVTYSYAAFGAPTESRDYGIVDAPSAQLAKEFIADQEGYVIDSLRKPAHARIWFLSCLTAELVI